MSKIVTAAPPMLHNSICITNRIFREMPSTRQTFLERCKHWVALLCIAGLLSLGGCATTGAGDPRDPLEPLNRGIYTFNEGLDTVLLKPLAEVYRGVIPKIVRTGISNVFSNLNDVIVALNNLLQGKLTNAASDVARVMVNTTVGVLGVIDVASKAGLEKHDEDFGQTLGYWGVGDGPYLVLPLLGPRTLRDSAGLVVDYRVDPVTHIDPSHDRNIASAARIVSRREELLGASKVLDVAALDPYQFLRDVYLQRRRNLIYDGNPPREKDASAGQANPSDSSLPSYWGGVPMTPAEEENFLRREARGTLAPR
jgi:phospholipid-binding lipoprotein MlaA